VESANVRAIRVHNADEADITGIISWRAMKLDTGGSY
jgi:hypothetical protein